MITLTEQLRKQINAEANPELSIDIRQGVLVARVMKNSPAAQAGIKAGDIIISVNNQKVVSAGDVQSAVETARIGTELPLKVRRNQKDVGVVVRPTAFILRGEEENP
jgi:S1-C subfamily serine protease